MPLILYLLFLMTIIIKICDNRMIQDHRIKSQNSPKYLSHDDSERFRSVREVQNIQYDPKINLSPMVDQDLLEDLEDEKENPLSNRGLVKKKHHRKRKRKRKKKKMVKGKKKGSTKHSNLRRSGNEMDFFNYQIGSRNERKNPYYPKKFTNKLRRSKSKIFSPNNVIEYLKRGQHSKLDNSEISENKNSQDQARHRLGRFATKRDNGKIKRYLASNYERRNNNIQSQDGEGENNCENENLDGKKCACKNGSPMDFEKQLEILNKGGEEVEKDKPGILDGIKKFFKPKEDNCSSLTTTLNPHRYQNQNKQDATVTEASLTINETTSEANSEVNNEANIEVNSKANKETTDISRATNIATSSTLIEIEDNTESFTEEISTNLHIGPSTDVTITAEKEQICSDLRHTIELDNKDSNTTPFPYNLLNEGEDSKDNFPDDENEFVNKDSNTTLLPYNLLNEGEDSKDNSPDDENDTEEPLASFILEIKAHPNAKKKSFRIKIKY